MNRQTAARRLACAGAFALFAAASSSCGDEPLGSAPVVSREQVLAAVTPDVAAQLLSNGTFDVRRAPPGSAPKIAQERARDLAVAYWRTFETELRWEAKNDRGAVAQDLRLCADVFYARSGYEPFGPDVPTYFARGFGDMWVFGMCAPDGEQQIAMAISTDATDLVIGEDGEVYGSLPGVFKATSVPVGLRYPVLPEFGVVTTARQMEARVAAVPVLQRGGGSTWVFGARWLLPMDTVVSVTGVESGVDRDLGRVYYGAYARGFATQDGDAAYAAIPRDEWITSADGVTGYMVRRRIDIPYRHEAVVKRNP